MTQTDRNGRIRRFVYDAIGRQTAEEWLDSSGNVIRTIQYVYDAAGQLLTASDPAATDTYRYDADGRVVAASNAGTPGVPVVLLNHGYDAASNRSTTSETIAGQAGAGTAYVYDALNRMTRITQTAQASPTNGSTWVTTPPASVRRSRAMPTWRALNL